MTDEANELYTYLYISLAVNLLFLVYVMLDK